ncbi:hypothetical protein RRG08_024262 [Elysia crispata]|uniref:Uncharacterized protein n=1 Tax=Elysia crispata TaxID=231223 RepID=A0AAE0Z2H1_9GAST|nr:hypothetical protein RRG08_024262 [Elysia crispata]
MHFLTNTAIFSRQTSPLPSNLLPFLSTFQILPVRLCVLSSPPPPCPGNASSSWCLWCASPSAHSNSTCACAFKEMVAPPRPPPPSPRSSPSLAPAVEWPRSTGPAAAANSKSTYSARGISCSSVGVAPSYVSRLALTSTFVASIICSSLCLVSGPQHSWPQSYVPRSALSLDLNIRGLNHMFLALPCLLTSTFVASIICSSLCLVS